MMRPSARYVAAAITARPPCLPPRRRRIAPAVVSQISQWARQVLGLPADLGVRVEEWVATDSRAVPHVVYISCGAGERGRCLTIVNASERIVYADLLVAAGVRDRGHMASTSW